MELKTARLTLLIDPNKKLAFERLCAQHDLTASQVVRQMIRDYLAHYGVSYTPSGLVDEEPAVPAVAAGRAQGTRRSAPPVKASAKAKVTAKRVRVAKA